eukprot:m.17217 g.17217  ORF g.17217 m.17217 type:complete len:179 (+) comp5153_c0_seq1:483-1019(+)
MTAPGNADEPWPSPWIVCVGSLGLALLCQNVTKNLVAAEVTRLEAAEEDKKPVDNGARTLRQALRVATLVACGGVLGGLVLAMSPAPLRRSAGHWVTVGVFFIYSVGLAVMWWRGVGRAQPEVAWDLKENTIKTAEPPLCKPCPPARNDLDLAKAFGSVHGTRSARLLKRPAKSTNAP